jgi:hypothetical protein
MKVIKFTAILSILFLTFSSAYLCEAQVNYNRYLAIEYAKERKMGSHLHMSLFS